MSFVIVGDVIWLLQWHSVEGQRMVNQPRPLCLTFYHADSPENGPQPSSLDTGILHRVAVYA